jgi:hypothetical protein
MFFDAFTISGIVTTLIVFGAAVVLMNCCRDQ